MPKYKIEDEKELYRKPVDFLNEKIQETNQERTSWESERRKAGERFSENFENLNEAWTKKYVRGSLIMLIVGFLMLIDRLINVEQLIPSEYAVIPLPYQLSMVAIVLFLAFWDLVPYGAKTLKEQKGYTVVCRIVYWLSVALVVFSFAQGDEMRSVLKGLAILSSCLVVLLLNNRQRYYVPGRKTGVKVLISLVRITVLICQVVLVFEQSLVKVFIQAIS